MRVCLYNKYMDPAAPTHRMGSGVSGRYFRLQGNPVPVLSISDMDGNRYALLQSHGRWVFVHFWASCCGPCRWEMPSIDRLQQLAGKPIDFSLINTKDTIFSFLAAHAPSLHSYLFARPDTAAQ